VREFKAMSASMAICAWINIKVKHPLLNPVKIKITDFPDCRGACLTVGKNVKRKTINGALMKGIKLYAVCKILKLQYKLHTSVRETE
jgi:hypothetical protein